MTQTSADINDRYAVQRRVDAIGSGGQERIRDGRVVVVGAGALGSAISQQLVRSGVGSIVLIDGDRIELSNLHRQVLYTEDDVSRGRLKVEAAAEHLRGANGDVSIEPIAERLGPRNARELIGDADVVVDGTDNLASRFAINQACVEAGVPWVYGGVAGTHGLVMALVPGRGPCLRCLFDGPPERETSTADTAGVFGPISAVIGALQAAAAIRLVVEERSSTMTKLISIDAWTGEVDAMEVKASPDCPVCGKR